MSGNVYDEEVEAGPFKVKEDGGDAESADTYVSIMADFYINILYIIY